MTSKAMPDQESGGTVRKAITVNVPQAHAFQVFTAQMDRWWPLATHKIGKQPAETVILEPKIGGRWFERSADGTECDWGHVRLWDPPNRLVLSWEISADFQSDASIQTEVEVRFVAESATVTTVHLEHRKLDAYGDQEAMVRSLFDSDSGWTGLLQRFASGATSGDPGPQPL